VQLCLFGQLWVRNKLRREFHQCVVFLSHPPSSLPCGSGQHFLMEGEGVSELPSPAHPGWCVLLSQDQAYQKCFVDPLYGKEGRGIPLVLCHIWFLEACLHCKILWRRIYYEARLKRLVLTTDNRKKIKREIQILCPYLCIFTAVTLRERLSLVNLCFCCNLQEEVQLGTLVNRGQISPSQFSRMMFHPRDLSMIIPRRFWKELRLFFLKSKTLHESSVGSCHM